MIVYIKIIDRILIERWDNQTFEFYKHPQSNRPPGPLLIRHPDVFSSSSSNNKTNKRWI